jgi:hypothetical protein
MDEVGLDPNGAWSLHCFVHSDYGWLVSCFVLPASSIFHCPTSILSAPTASATNTTLLRRNMSTRPSRNRNPVQKYIGSFAPTRKSVRWSFGDYSLPSLILCSKASRSAQASAPAPPKVKPATATKSTVKSKKKGTGPTKMVRTDRRFFFLSDVFPLDHRPGSINDPSTQAKVGSPGSSLELNLILT